MQSDAIPFSKEYLEGHASPPVINLLTRVDLINSPLFPSVPDLNRVLRRYCDNWDGPEFKAQRLFLSTETRYYETIIRQDNVVPTRENNWHDLFNVLIWAQFPKAKRRLNELHVIDIEQCGVSPRTQRRNRLTHFDECGVVLAVESPSNDLPDDEKQAYIAFQERFLAKLAHHKWHDVFLNEREVWGNKVTPFVFGHANLEMMLNPFIGLTGKWLAVVVPSGFSELSWWEQRKAVDMALVNRISALDDFLCAPILKPIPLLGVPGWHREAQTLCFYNNVEYFRPVNAKAKPSLQLPLFE